VAESLNYAVAMLGTGFVVGGALLAAGGTALTAVGVLGLRRRLPRNRFAGVRTVNTLRDDVTFAVGNQVGAPLTIAAGGVAVFGGLAVLAARSGPVALTVLAVAVLGMAALTITGGVLGDRAARAVPPPTVAGCAGSCAGCSLVAGCGTAPDPTAGEPHDAGAPVGSTGTQDAG
jgi:hypothetical protein